MRFSELVEQHKDLLTAADQRVVRELLVNPTEAAFLSATGLAERGSVHPATVVRLAQKLGFSGYPGLKAELQAEVLNTSHPAERLRHRLEHVKQGSILADIIDSELTALHQLADQDPEAEINAAAQALMGARQVFLFAQGNATTLVELMDRRLRRSEFRTLILRQQGRDLAEHALALGPEDVVLAFAFHSVPTGLTPLLQHTARIGAASILVTDILGPLVTPRPDIVIAAKRGLAEEYLTLTVPMAICNALILTIAQLDQGRSLKALGRLAELTGKFTEGRTP
jgi:DNA-binding MurR/RpiR family transcriptional regulator